MLKTVLVSVVPQCAHIEEEIFSSSAGFCIDHCSIISNSEHESTYYSSLL